MSGAVSTPPTARTTAKPSRHAADVDPYPRATHAACHPAAEHLEDVTDVDPAGHPTFPEVEPLAPLRHVAVFVESVRVLHIALFRVR